MAGLSSGGNDYITKPYDIDEFRARVMGFLRLVDSVKSRSLSGSARKKLSIGVSSLLSEKELSVALYTAEGLSNKEITDKVYLSESRVKTCLSSVYRKLGITEKKDKRNILAEILHD